MSDQVEHLAGELIRFDTTNRGGGDGNERAAAEYVAEKLAGAGLEPVLLESARNRTNVVARIPGQEEGDALLLHAHLDVVPADPADWTVDPFCGELRDDVLWGRGAVDMKGAAAVLLALARQQRKRDIVLAFTADEEDTAEYGARYLVEQHRDLFEGCTVAVGESGGFTYHAANGARLYPVASAERGTAWLRLTARGRAGHGAKPNDDNAVAHLAAAITRIADYQWPVRLIPTVRAAVEAIEAATGEGLGNALVSGTTRNSANPTMLNAGYKINVIPEQATAYVDGRVLPGYEEEFARTLTELTGPRVTWEYAHREPPVESPPPPAAMRVAIEAEDPGAVVVPYCMTGGTDAKQFARLGMDCYGFTPLVLPEGFDYYAMFHGTDERVPASALRAALRIMDRFLDGYLALARTRRRIVKRSGHWYADVIARNGLL